jgi:hypothetical protein
LKKADVIFALAIWLIYEKYKRKIPPKMCVCHTCDNPECINPDHLFLGTQRDNVLDMIRKGRENHLRGEEHHMAKLTAIEVIEIKESEKSYIRLASQYDISVTTIWRIKKNLNWKHIFLNRDNHNATIPHRKEGC